MWTHSDIDPVTSLGATATLTEGPADSPLLSIAETGVAEPCGITLDAQARIGLARELLSGTGLSVGYAAVAAPASLAGVR